MPAPAGKGAVAAALLVSLLGGLCQSARRRIAGADDAGARGPRHIAGMDCGSCSERPGGLHRQLRQRIQYLPPDQSLGGSGLAATLGGRAGQWAAPCAAAKDVPPADEAAARRFFESRFQAYRVSQLGDTTALVTGYFEPEVAGDVSEEGPYRTPLLGLPPDLVTFDLGAFDPAKQGVKSAVGRLQNQKILPYYDRFEIENGALDPASLAIAWVADPVDAYFLQVEGSGTDRPAGRQRDAGDLCRQERPPLRADRPRHGAGEAARRP